MKKSNENVLNVRLGKEEEEEEEEEEEDSEAFLRE